MTHEALTYEVRTIHFSEEVCCAVLRKENWKEQMALSYLTSWTSLNEI